MLREDKKIEKVFHIEIMETLSNMVEVRAENEQEALLKVRDRYRNEEFFCILTIVLTPNSIFLNTLKKPSPHPIITSDCS